MDKWIKLPQHIVDNPYYAKDSFSFFQAFMDLIFLATDIDIQVFNKRGMPVSLKRGQVMISQMDLSVRWKWSRGKVIRQLKVMEDLHLIIQIKSKVCPIIEICNYDSYSTTDKSQSINHQDVIDEIQQMLGSQQWLEVVCMQQHIKKSDITALLEQFANDCIARGLEYHQNFADAKRHFISWLRIKKDGDNRQYNNENERYKRIKDYADVAAAFRRESNDATQVW